MPGRVLAEIADSSTGRVLAGAVATARPSATRTVLAGTRPAMTGAPAGPGLTGPGHTGPGLTGPGHTGPGLTGPGHTVPGHTGPGHTVPGLTVPGPDTAPDIVRSPSLPDRGPSAIPPAHPEEGA
ncbi:hypothetical protein [Streptomyces sp. SudanB182_2057]|uniref:hypothetical protein n=1 Tax=Streptomyces sp. SudanB182_2057 TaxID=3035281 RepID=UPI003F54E5D7